MNKKILFIQPTIYDDSGKLLKKKKLYFVGLAHPLLSALLPEGWSSEICLEVIEEIPWDTDCDVIGIGGVGHAARRAKDIAIEFKKRGKIVFMGGPMVSLIPEFAKEYCDSVMIGDSEETIAELCKDIENNCLKPFYEKPLSQISIPGRHGHLRHRRPVRAPYRPVLGSHRLLPGRAGQPVFAFCDARHRQTLPPPGAEAQFVASAAVRRGHRRQLDLAL